MTSSTTPLLLPSFTADPSTWAANGAFARSDLGVLKSPVGANGTTLGTDFIPFEANDATLSGINFQAQQQLNAAVSSQQESANSVTAVQMVAGIIGDSSSSQAAAAGGLSWASEMSVRAYHGGKTYGGGWISAAANSSTTGLGGTPPVSTSVSSTGTHVYTYNGLSNSGGTLSAASRTGWGPDNSDDNCSSGTCTWTFTAGTVTGYTATRIVVFLHQQASGSTPTYTVNGGGSTGGPSTNGTAATPVYIDTGTLTAQQNLAVVVTCASPCDLSGAEVWNGTTGTKVDLDSFPGAQSLRLRCGADGNRVPPDTVGKAGHHNSGYQIISAATSSLPRTAIRN